MDNSFQACKIGIQIEYSGK